ALSHAEIRRARGHYIFEGGRELQHLIVHHDGIDRILRKILGFSCNNGNHLALEVDLSWQGRSGWSILEGEDVSNTLHGLGPGSVNVLNPRARMRAGEDLRVEHIGKPNSCGVLRFSRKPRNRDLWHWRYRFSQHVEILRRIALPLFCNDLLIAFDQRIA